MWIAGGREASSKEKAKDVGTGKAFKPGNIEGA